MITRQVTFVALLLMLLQAFLMPGIILAQTNEGVVGYYYNNDNNRLVVPATSNIINLVGGALNVCADGSSCLLIKWVRPEVFIQQCGYNYISDIFIDTNAVASASFDAYHIDYGDSIRGFLREYPTAYLSGGTDSLIAYYSNPFVPPPSNSLFRNLYLHFRIRQYCDVHSAYIAFTIPIHVYRAPVVMIHGLWGNIGTFTKMKNAMLSSGWPTQGIGNDPDGPLLYRKDYKATNTASFLTNANVVPNAIIEAITKAVNSGYAAGGVDIVAHSMGGVLSISWIYDSPLMLPLFPRIHKLITINSPLAGSQSANLLSDLTNNNFTVSLKLIYNLLKYGTLGNAVNDLCVDSPAIKELRNYAQLVGFPKHAIITTTGGNFINLYDNEWDAIFSILTNKILLGSAKLLYNNEDNDLIVPYSSQSGGLPAPNISVISPQKHVGSPSNDSVIAEVISLLNMSPNDPAFTKEPYNPPELTYNLPTLNKKQYSAGSIGSTQSQIIINTLQRGSTALTGSKINVAISGSADVSSVLFLAGKPSAGIYIDSLNSSSGTISYTIPNNVVGPIALVAAGFSGNSLVAYDSLQLFVSTTAILDSILAEPTVAYLSAGDSMSITVTGKYNDNVDRDISDNPQLTLTCKNATVATLSQSNLIRGIIPGTTTVTVSYLGKNAILTLNVYSGAVTSVSNGPGSLTKSGTIPSNYALQQNFPNPFNPSTTINYSLPKAGNVKLTIYNAIGSKVATVVNEYKPAGNYSVQFNGSNLASGIYLYRLESGNYSTAKKFILMK